MANVYYEELKYSMFSFRIFLYSSLFSLKHTPTKDLSFSSVSEDY